MRQCPAVNEGPFELHTPAPVKWNQSMFIKVNCSDRGTVVPLASLGRLPLHTNPSSVQKKPCTGERTISSLRSQLPSYLLSEPGFFEVLRRKKKKSPSSSVSRVSDSVLTPDAGCPRWWDHTWQVPSCPTKQTQNTSFPPLIRYETKSNTLDPFSDWPTCHLLPVPSLISCWIIEFIDLPAHRYQYLLHLEIHKHEIISQCLKVLCVSRLLA